MFNETVMIDSLSSKYRPKNKNVNTATNAGRGYSAPSMNYSVFNALRDNLNQGYGRTKQSLADQWNQALESLGKQRKRGAEQFASGRAGIAENAYDQARQQSNTLASRGLATSGIKDLAKVQQRIAQGNQVSNLANQYYDFANNLTDKETQGRNQYNSTLAELENQLQAGLGSINMQEWNAKNQEAQQRAEMAYRNSQNALNNTKNAGTEQLQALSNAANLINLGLDSTSIQKYTGLPIDEINKIKANTTPKTLDSQLPLIYKNMLATGMKERDAKKLLEGYIASDPLAFYSGSISQGTRDILNPQKAKSILNPAYDSSLDWMN